MIKKITLKITTIFLSILLIALSHITLPSLATKHVCIIIPAYNEQYRIEKTLRAFANYFNKKSEKTTFLVVANNCKDDTVSVVKKVQKDHENILYLDLKPGGKGFAIKEGFKWTLDKAFDLIGFVDADMATEPQYFYDLITASVDSDGAIASRYASGARISPKRPFLRKLGGKFYNWMLRSRLGIGFKDTQCGAKIFSKDTVAKITPYMEEKGWAADLEMLYLCKLFNKKIKEIPTTWSDQPGTHLQISSKLAKEFLNSPKRIKQRHEKLKKDLSVKKPKKKSSLNSR
ncbi:glycosyltransferase [Candidatus Dependentiae bacterium]|nr:glycosyltransferase [Candidatus Dependentiae bacterium]